MAKEVDRITESRCDETRSDFVCFVVVIATSERGSGRCPECSKMDDPSGDSLNGADDRVTRSTEADNFSLDAIFLLSKVRDPKVAARSSALVAVAKFNRRGPMNNCAEELVSRLEPSVYSPGRSKKKNASSIMSDVHRING